jgi:hypothetical protein
MKWQKPKLISVKSFPSGKGPVKTTCSNGSAGDDNACEYGTSTNVCYIGTNAVTCYGGGGAPTCTTGDGGT